MRRRNTAMSQRAEKYARKVEREINYLKRWVHKTWETVEDNEGLLWSVEQDRPRVAKDLRRLRRELARTQRLQRRGMAAALLLAALALMIAFLALGSRAEDRQVPEGKQFVSMAANIERDHPLALLADTVPASLAPYGMEDPLEAEEIEAALLAQGYFSADVPMCYEYQDYMRTYCQTYGCPYPLALAVAEVESRFNMEAVGAVGEVGIMQLNPGPDGAYHAELEEATGLDPTTAAGNIAGGCYLLGKYLSEYEAPTMAAMAYSMGQAGAEKAREAGIASTEYTKAVLEAVERWERVVGS